MEIFNFPYLYQCINVKWHISTDMVPINDLSYHLTAFLLSHFVAAATLTF